MYGRPAGRPLTEDRDYAAHTKKGQLRGRMARDLLAAHQAGRVEVAIGRASDYFGPRGGAQSNLGDRLFPAALAGSTATVLGDPDQPHTYTYIPDIGEGLAVLGEHPEAPGQVWHLPNDPHTRTTRQLVDVVYRLAGQPRTRVRQMPPLLLRLASLTNRDAARAAGDAVPVRGAVHRGQQQDHEYPRRSGHTHRAGPGRHPGHLSRRSRCGSLQDQHLLNRQLGRDASLMADLTGANTPTTLAETATAPNRRPNRCRPPPVATSTCQSTICLRRTTCAG